MISRWLNNPRNQQDIESSGGKVSAEQMKADTAKYLQNSLNLSQQTFQKFIDLFEMKERPIILKSK